MPRIKLFTSFGNLKVWDNKFKIGTHKHFDKRHMQKNSGLFARFFPANYNKK